VSSGDDVVGLEGIILQGHEQEPTSQPRSTIPVAGEGTLRPSRRISPLSSTSPPPRSVDSHTAAKPQAHCQGQVCLQAKDVLTAKFDMQYLSKAKSVLRMEIIRCQAEG
jgi:hypothetical protein